MIIHRSIGEPAASWSLCQVVARQKTGGRQDVVASANGSRGATGCPAEDRLRGRSKEYHGLVCRSEAGNRRGDGGSAEGGDFVF